MNNNNNPIHLKLHNVMLIWLSKKYYIYYIMYYISIKQSNAYSYKELAVECNQSLGPP